MTDVSTAMREDFESKIVRQIPSLALLPMTDQRDRTSLVRAAIIADYRTHALHGRQSRAGYPAVSRGDRDEQRRSASWGGEVENRTRLRAA